jgi:predicted phosphodiesterase
VRVAILSDIHGNLPALEAVIDDIEEAGPDEIWCGGDLGWAGPWATQCIATVRKAGWPTVKGNTDVWITGDPQTLTTDQDRKELQEVAGQHGISDDDARWLIERPLSHSGPGSILLVHGTPTSPFVGPLPDDPAPEFRPYEGHASIVVYAHVHRAFTRRLADGTIVCNTGSVGLPMDQETASYLLIDRVGPDVTLRHRRVSFDRQKCLEAARLEGGALQAKFTALFGSS